MYRLQGFPCGADYAGQVVNIDAQNVPEDGRAENLQIEKRNRRPFRFGQLMKSKRPPIKICFQRTGRNGRQAQGSSEKFCEIHFLRPVTDFLERFRKDLSDGIFGFDALSCSDQEESIQSLNVIKRGGCVQFSTCYLGIPELSRGNRVGTCRRVGVSACRRVWRVWVRGVSACGLTGSPSPVVSPIFTFARSIDGQRRSRGSATLPRHARARPHAHAPHAPTR